MSAMLPAIPYRHRCFILAASSAAALIVATGCRSTQTHPAEESASANLELVQVDSGVYAAIRKEPLSLAVNSNSLIMVRDSDVVVVDAQFTRKATRETISAIRSITEKPVGYVINTHCHDDHLAGNQVYRDSFPSVRFVMRENTAADLRTLGAENRKNQVAGAPPVADEYERLLSRGLGIDSTPASPLERSSVESAIRIVRQYLEEHPGFRPVTATDTVRRRMTLGQGRPRIDLLWFGHGNTRGDLVVHLPAQGIVASGDLVVAPIPFAFNSYPVSWITVLDSLAALKPRMIVPGHGPVMRDLRYLRSVRDWLARITRETSFALTRGDSLGAALERVVLDDVRRSVTGDEKWMNFLFRRFFVRPAVRAMYEGRSGG
ncbi:MAG TPA: MBL fold metallo-hydrolase [Gemmatimonadales bacterium]|nr:MBL fold metallo-hydrolase [Gemmatimonadales bacterium]